MKNATIPELIVILRHVKERGFIKEDDPLMGEIDLKIHEYDQWLNSDRTRIDDGNIFDPEKRV